MRMNFSHGSYEYHQSVIDNVRKMVAGAIKCTIDVGSTDGLFNLAETAEPGPRPIAIALDTVGSTSISRLIRTHVR